MFRVAEFPLNFTFGDVEYLQGTQHYTLIKIKTYAKIRMPGDLGHRGRKGIKQLRFPGANDYVDLGYFKCHVTVHGELLELKVEPEAQE